MSCPQCFTGSVLEGEPTGVISEIDGAYFAAGPSDGNSGSKRAVIFLTDVFGLKLKNSKILADQFAQHLKCDVWIPDVFAGKPPVTVEQMKTLPDRAGVKFGIWEILKLVPRVLPSVPALLITNRSAVVDGRTISFVKKLQEKKKYDNLGAIGYCFGGGIATRVGATTTLFNSIILVHPSPPTDDQLKAIKAPTAWSMPEDDMGIKPARLEEIERLYAARKGKDTFVDYEIKVYKGCAHGFGARPNFEYPDVKEGFEKAFQQAVDWFNKTIPGTPQVAIICFYLLLLVVSNFYYFLSEDLASCSTATYSALQPSTIWLTLLIALTKTIRILS
ncbi:DLH domain-containing protein [Mycena venus]|uniref:DLH domain-containing protein n=1 Tax=Mycena venus TaxID=2733690 RepID=A0A8H6YQ90_9AGAR|nr:DLH domain-containing protein [Mycena venus]